MLDLVLVCSRLICDCYSLVRRLVVVRLSASVINKSYCYSEIYIFFLLRGFTTVLILKI